MDVANGTSISGTWPMSARKYMASTATAAPVARQRVIFQESSLIRA
jgi:hypothetical protein